MFSYPRQSSSFLHAHKTSTEISATFSLSVGQWISPFIQTVGVLNRDKGELISSGLHDRAKVEYRPASAPHNALISGSRKSWEKVFIVNLIRDSNPPYLFQSLVTTTNLVTAVTTIDPLLTTIGLVRPNLNYTSAEVMEKLSQKINTRAIDEAPLICLLVAYSILITTGAVGNGLVCIAVARKPAMRTARNIYIINLAISDLILCLFTMPFSLLEIVLKYWPLGQVTCKLVAGLEATSIFVSTISIMAIAIDRYKVIVYPTKGQFNPVKGFLMVATIWLFALLLAMPLFLYKAMVRHENPHKSLLLQYGFRISDLDFCVERWPIESGG